MAWLRRAMAFRPLALGTLAANVVGAVVGVALAYAGWELGSLVAMTLAREAAVIVFLAPAVRWRPRLRFPVDRLRELRPFAARASVIPMLEYGMDQADNLVIGGLLGPVALAYYAIGARVMRFLRALAVDPLENFLLPTFARQREGRAELVHALASTWRWLSLLAFPMFAAIAVAARDIVRVTLGPEWEPAVPVIQVLATAGALKVIVAPARSALMGMGLAGVCLKLDALVAALSLGGFLVGARWGIVGVAAAHVAAALVAFVTFTIALGRRLETSWAGGVVALGILLAAAVFGSAHLVQSWTAGASVVVRLGATAATALVVYALGTARLILSLRDAAPAPVAAGAYTPAPDE
jgi:PST family polysaccharide transporter